MMYMMSRTIYSHMLLFDLLSDYTVSSDEKRCYAFPDLKSLKRFPTLKP